MALGSIGFGVLEATVVVRRNNEEQKQELASVRVALSGAENEVSRLRDQIQQVTTEVESELSSERC